MQAPQNSSERCPAAFNLDTMRNLNYEKGEHLWPEINYAQISAYFLEKESHDGNASKAFRALDAYQYVKSGKVHDIKTARPRPGLRVLKGYVSPSQRQGPLYECWVQTTEDGQIQDARCTCMAGLGRSCSHAAAVCFAVDFRTQVSSGSAAPTDFPCQWVKPRLKKIQAKNSKELSFKRHTYGVLPTVPPKRKGTGPRGLPDAKSFMQKLQEVAPCARVFTLTTCRPREKAAEQMPLEEDIFTDVLAVTPEFPLSAFTATFLSRRGLQCENVGELAQIVMEKLIITGDDARAIELGTRSQRDSSLWFLHRKGRVTASIFKDVCRSKKVRCSTLINRIFSPRFINVPAVQYGITNEPVAKERLLDHLRQQHTNARIEDCGLMINPNYPLLGCSPDGIFRCDCHDPALIEIKCLYSLRDCNPADLIAQGQQKKDFCLDSAGRLKQSHSYYYQVQAQLHLNLHNIRKCYFYVHIENGGHLVVIEREEDFMYVNTASVYSFIREIVMPRIILGNTV